MKISKISTNERTWYELKYPVEVSTISGKQKCTKFFFNGFDEHLKVILINLIDETFYTLRGTPNHPLMLYNGDWIKLGELNESHFLFGGWMLYDISKEDTPISTMDMEVPHDHHYILESGIVSHNTALIQGGVSQGIEPILGNVFTQGSAAGESDRVNPVFLKIMKERGQFKKKVLEDIAEKMGSVQHLDWLTDHEKKVFKTAFEIDQRAILRLASARSRYIDQWQSLNLFFSADEDEEYISEIHQEAFMDENILGLYYVRTQAGVLASKDDCVACQ